MSLAEVKSILDKLSPDERREVRAYLDRLDAEVLPVRGETPEERIQHLNAAAAAIREGLSKAELDELTALMNEEYVEPDDDALWTD